MATPKGSRSQRFLHKSGDVIHVYSNQQPITLISAVWQAVCNLFPEILNYYFAIGCGYASFPRVRRRSKPDQISSAARETSSPATKERGMIMQTHKTTHRSIHGESLPTSSNEVQSKNIEQKPGALGSSRRAFVAGIAALTAAPILRPFAASRGEFASGPQAPIERIADNSRQQIARVMRRSAAAVGLFIETAGMSVVSREGAVGVATTVAGLEHMPATDLIGGIDTGFMYLSGASSLPPGFYLLRATASTADTGPNMGLLELFDRSGALVLTEETVFDIDSLTLPQRPRGFVPTTTIGIVHTDSFDPPCVFEICFLCSNGYGVVCLRIPIATCFVFML
jgi:hypothetical protein